MMVELMDKVLACPSCGASAWKDETTGEEVRCLSCGETVPVVSGVPVLVRDWRAISDRLDAARAENPAWYVAEQSSVAASPWRHHLAKRRRYVGRVLGQFLARRRWEKVPRLLDLGCGDGTNLDLLRPFAEHLYACDYNAVRLVRARARDPGAMVFLADTLDHPGIAGTFDVIFFNHVLEHIVDDEKALAGVRRLLAPGGLLILGVPNEGAWWWQLAYRLQPEILKSSDHVHFYTASIIRSKLVRQGFCVSDVARLGWGPPHWGWDGRIRGYKLVDDVFEVFGRLFLRGQCSSLYLLATADDGVPP